MAASANEAVAWVRRLGCGCGEKHVEGSCVAHVATVFLKSLTIGAAGKTLLNTLSFLLVIKKKLKKKKGIKKILDSLIDVRWGMFLALLSGGTTGVSCLLRTLILKSITPKMIRHVPDLDQPSETPKEGASTDSSSSVTTTSSSEFSSSSSSIPTRAGGLSSRASSGVRSTSRKLTPEEAAQRELLRKKLVVAREKGLFLCSDLLSGGVAGLSLFCLKAEDRKSFALYFLTRSLEFLCRTLAIQKRLLEWMMPLGEHADVILMCVTASQILYSYAFEPETLSPSYFKFLCIHGGKDRRVIGAIAELHQHRPMSLDPFRSFCAEQNVAWEPALREFQSFQICPILHPHVSCTRHYGQFIYDAFFRALPLYAPIHIITTAVVLILKATAKLKERRRRLQLQRSMSEEELALQGLSQSSELRQLALKRRFREILVYTMDRILLRLFVNIFRSSMFLALYCASAWFAACLVHRLNKVNGPGLVRVALGSAGLACLLEVKSRRGELAMYCLPQALESLANEMILHKVIPAWVVRRSKHLDVLLFCFALATTIFCFKNEPTSIKPSFYFGMKWLWG